MNVLNIGNWTLFKQIWKVTNKWISWSWSMMIISLKLISMIFGTLWWLSFVHFYLLSPLNLSTIWHFGELLRKYKPIQIWKICPNESSYQVLTKFWNNRDSKDHDAIFVPWSLFLRTMSSKKIGPFSRKMTVESRFSVLFF